MNTKKYTWLFYFITLTIITTIGVQFYWNYKNYEENKQRVANEIQLSLDNAVEEYYSSLAKSNFITIIGKNATDSKKIKIFDAISNDSNKLKKSNKKFGSKITLNSIKITTDENYSKKKLTLFY